MDRIGFRPDASVVSRGLPHDYGSVSHIVSDRNHRTGCSPGHGTHALWGQALAAHLGRAFAGVRTGEVDYNSGTGALLFRSANGASHPGGFNQGRRADGFAARPDYVAAAPWNSAGAGAACGSAGLAGGVAVEALFRQPDAGR